MTSPHDSAQVAALLDTAARDVLAIDQIGLAVDPAQAYRIQAMSIARRIERGERAIGVKMGLTSRAKMAQVGIDEAIWGRLTDAMLLPDGANVDPSRFIQPRAEPEIAFRLRAPLSGEVSEEEAWAAIDGVAAAIEIIDSRFRNFRFNLADAIADNCSSSALVLGPWQAPGLDVGNLGMVLEIDGEPVGMGSSAAILGHPLRSLVQAAALTHRYGGELAAGDVFMCGASTAAVALAPGMRVRLRVHGLDECGFRMNAAAAGQE